jgi:hypothetical protein
MPVNGYPAGFTNSWPATLHEYSDRAVYEDDPVWKAERAAESNWSRPRPSSIEIARMETAIVWPAHYLGHVRIETRKPGRQQFNGSLDPFDFHPRAKSMVMVQPSFFGEKAQRISPGWEPCCRLVWVLG